MSKKDFEKELRKKTDKIHSVRTEVYLVGRKQSYLILALSIVVMVGMIFSFVPTIDVVRIIGSVIMGAGGLTVIILYSALRRKGPLSYTVIDFIDDRGEWITIQYLSKKTVALFYRGVVIRCEKNYVTVCDKLFYENPKWDWFSSLKFDSCVERDKQMTQLSAKTEQGTAILQLKNGFPYYAEVFGKRIHYFEINALSKEFLVPSEFVAAMRKLGIKPPSFVKSL